MGLVSPYSPQAGKTSVSAESAPSDSAMQTTAPVPQGSGALSRKRKEAVIADFGVPVFLISIPRQSGRGPDAAGEIARGKYVFMANSPDAVNFARHFLRVQAKNANREDFPMPRSSLPNPAGEADG